MHGFVLVCMFSLGVHLSNTARWSLKLMGPPVASLLIFLQPSPLGCVLARCPRPPGDLRANQYPLPLLPVLVLLVALGGLAAYCAQIWLAFLGVLAACLHNTCRSSRLKPRPAVWGAGLLLLSVGGRSFGPQRGVQDACAVWFALTVPVGSLRFLLFALLLPNSVAELLHAVQLRVVQQG